MSNIVATPTDLSIASALPPAVSGLRVLLAEDDLVSQGVARRLLERLGHQVTIAPNGRLAVEQWQQAGAHPFDLILMDVMMPEMGGFEAIACIREQERARGLHGIIVSLTADDRPGDREHCLQAGADDYLPKPLRSQALMTKLREIRARQGHE